MEAVNPSTVEHLSSDELEALRALSNEQTKRSERVLPEFLRQLSIACDSDYRFVLHNQLGWVIGNEASMRVFTTIYPEADSEELDDLIRLDGAAFGKVNSCAFDPSNPWYESDHKLLRPYLFGTTEPLQILPYKHLSAANATPLISRRLKEGMPRTMKLLAAIELMRSLSANRETFTYSMPVFHNIPKVFALSDEELQTICQLTASMGREHAIAQLVLSNTEACMRFCDDNGELLSERLGGEQVVASALGDFFKDKARYTHLRPVWEAMVTNLGEDRVEQLLPFEQRRAIILTRLAKYPHLPKEFEQVYISPEEVAQAAYNKIAASLESELPKYGWGLERTNYSPSHAAIDFGLSDTPFRLEKLERYSKLVSLLHQTAPEASDLSAQAEAWLVDIAAIDRQLLKWFEEYSDEKHNRDLEPLPVDGWSGAPEEELIIQDHVASGNRSRARMAEIEQTVRAYLASQPDEQIANE